MFDFLKPKPKKETFDKTIEVEQPLWVKASADGVVVKCTGEELKQVLDKLIDIGLSSQAIKTHLYFKCVPEEYRKVVVERNYYKLKYEELVGYQRLENKNVKPNSRPKSIKTQQKDTSVSTPAGEGTTDQKK